MAGLVDESLKQDPTRIHPSVTLTIAKIVECYGLDSRALLSEFGVDLDHDLTHEKRVVGAVNDAIWRAALMATKDDSIGIKFAKYFQIGSLRGLGFCWAASNTLLDGFIRFAKYFSVISSAGKVIINKEHEAYRITLALPVPYGIAADSGVDAMLALFVHLSRLVTGEKLSPKSVNLQRPQPVSYQAFDDFLIAQLTMMQR